MGRTKQQYRPIAQRSVSSSDSEQSPWSNALQVVRSQYNVARSFDDKAIKSMALRKGFPAHRFEPRRTTCVNCAIRQKQSPPEDASHHSSDFIASISSQARIGKMAADLNLKRPSGCGDQPSFSAALPCSADL